eukprot:NODE_388_length_8234_cov_1.030731.p2 type:complete len:517 gc:universal NODE_388_length_8234_cov_1.030731:4125-2575(-)
MSSRLPRKDSIITEQWSEYVDGINWTHYGIDKPENAQKALDLLKTDITQYLKQTVENLLDGYFISLKIDEACGNELCEDVENYFPDLFPSCFKIKKYLIDASKINYIPKSHTYASFPLFKGPVDKPSVLFTYIVGFKKLIALKGLIEQNKESLTHRLNETRHPNVFIFPRLPHLWITGQFAIHFDQSPTYLNMPCQCLQIIDKMAEKRKAFDGYRVWCFDLQNFYSTLYSHTLTWLLTSVEMGKRDWDNRKHGIWMEMIDKAIGDCKGSRLHGLPTGSLIFHEVAEAYLRLLDIALLNALRSKFPNQDVSDFQIIRRSDNYELYFEGVSKEQVLDIIINTLLIYELGINPYKKRCFEIGEMPSKYYANTDLKSLSMLDEKNDVKDIVKCGSDCQDIVPLMLEWATVSSVDHFKFYAMLDKYEDCILYSPRSIQRLSYLWYICRNRIFSFEFEEGKSRNNDLVKLTTSNADTEEGTNDVFNDLIKFYNGLKSKTIDCHNQNDFLDFKNILVDDNFFE